MHRSNGRTIEKIELRMTSARAELVLPQPSAEKQPQYSYALYEGIQSTYFSSSTLSKGSLCWVLKSKEIARAVKHQASNSIRMTTIESW